MGLLLLNQTISLQMKFVGRLLENLREKKVYLLFRENILGVDLANMQSLSKYNRGIKHLLYAIDLLSKFAWIVPLKNKEESQKEENQIKYGLIRVVNFAIIFLRCF